MNVLMVDARAHLLPPAGVVLLLLSDCVVAQLKAKSSPHRR